MTAELSRPVPLARIGPAGLDLVVRATPEECAAVARRMDLPAIRTLTCAFHLSRDPDEPEVILGMGHLRAEVTRVCVVSAEEFEMVVEDHFEVRFVPDGEESDDVDPDHDDEIPYDNGLLDLGEAAAEQLGLVLDPYPRMEGAVMPEIEDDADDPPFAALRRRDKRH